MIVGHNVNLSSDVNIGELLHDLDFIFLFFYFLLLKEVGVREARRDNACYAVGSTTPETWTPHRGQAGEERERD